MTAPAAARSPIHPLDEFYVRGERALLPFASVTAGDVPEPYRTLLVHERDMTRTLENFHGGTIHLRVLSSYHEGDAYWRESVLQLDGSNRPVEFGAIKIHLDRFPEPWRAQILAEHLPLGGILNASGLGYTSRPTAYLRFTPDEFITCALHLEKDALLYGRQNALRDTAGNVLAEIIEILPPALAEKP
jgi:chorismate-pyruvate lyase